MSRETPVTVRLDSSSLFAALNRQVGEFRLADHEFNTAMDELHVSTDTGGSGRVAVTVVFEFDATQMAQLLRDARPAD